MDTRTGDLYPSTDAALAQGVDPAHLVEVTGPPQAIDDLQAALRKAAAEAALAAEQPTSDEVAS